jgi:hypothetical protein
MTFESIYRLGIITLFFWASMGGFARVEAKEYTCYRLASPPMIDGDLSDWPGLPVILLGSEDQVSSGEWLGPADTQGVIRIGWDDKAMYFAIQIQDDEIVQNLPDGNAGDIFMQDSIQWAIDINKNGGSSYDGDDYEYGFGQTASGPCVYRWHVSRAALVPGLTRQVDLAVKHINGGKTIIYEAAVPFDQLLPLRPSAGTQIGFNIVVQDLDGEKKKTLEWTPGITAGKSPGLFGTLTFSDAAASGQGNVLISGLKNVDVKPVVYRVLALDAKGECKGRWTLKDEKGRTVQQGALTKVDQNKFSATFEWRLEPAPLAAGKYVWAVSIHQKGVQEPLRQSMTIERVPIEKIDSLTQQVKALTGELKALIEPAKAKGIETAYATGVIAVSEMFEIYTQEDIKNSQFVLVLRNLETTAGRLREQIDSLRGQMENGPLAFLNVPSQDMSQIEIRGDGFYVGDKPVMLVGTMGWLWTIYPWRDKFGEFGFNTFKSDIEPLTVYSDKGIINPEFPWWAMVETIHSAKTHNLAMASSPLPSQVWGALLRGGSVSTQEFKKGYQTYLGVMYEQLGSGSFACHAMAAEGHRPTMVNPNDHLSEYRAWLAGAYQSIEQYNQICGTKFKSFDEVSFPDAGETNPGRKYDRTAFMQQLVASLLKWSGDEIKKRDPKSFLFGYASYLMMDDESDFFHTWYYDPELDFEAYDIADADTAGNFSSKKYLMDTIHWLAMYRDLVGGLAPGKPQFDCEFHLANERRPYPKNWTAAIHFQAYIHGLSGSYAWCWLRNDRVDSAILLESEVCMDLSRTALDLRRLAGPIDAFHKQKPQVAILYSQASSPYSSTPTQKAHPGHFGPVVSSHLKQMQTAYEGMFFEGIKLGFVSERKIQAGVLDDYKLLIVPAASHVTDEVVEKVQQFAARGGTVVLVGECFTFDHRCQKRKALLKNENIFRCASLVDAAHARSELSSWLDKLSLRPAVAVLSKQSFPTVEWRYVNSPSQGELLYLLNIGHKPVKVFLNRQGKPVEGVDLRTGEAVSASSELEPLGLHLLKINPRK